MNPLLPSEEKYEFSGIGSASAAVVFAALAANPTTSWMTVGVIPGKIVFYILSRVFSKFASKGVVLLNVGADSLLTAMEKSAFDGSLESSYKLIDEIRSSGRNLTEDETKKIDEQVILQFRKFAKMTRGKK